MQFNFWRRWMADKRVSLKVLVEKDLRNRVGEAAEHEGLTVEAWIVRTLSASLAPTPVPMVATPAQVAMEAAFDSLDTPGEPSYPGVMPMPPAPAAPIAEAAVPAPSINATPQITTAAPYIGHSCIHLQPGRTAQYTREQIQGTCMVQGGRVCHWASHVAKNCDKFRARRMMTPPMPPPR
jgi:hypothetical protein